MNKTFQYTESLITNIQQIFKKLFLTKIMFLKITLKSKN